MIRVFVSRDCVESVLGIAKLAYPNETILLLRGNKKSNDIYVSEALMPPPRYVSFNAASLNLNQLPIDFSIVGIAHSHPSGSLMPSTQDLLSRFKYFMMIVGYPFRSKQDLAAYDYEGNRLELLVSD